MFPSKTAGALPAKAKCWARHSSRSSPPLASFVASDLICRKIARLVPYLLEGSWVLVRSTLNKDIIIVTLLITLLISTHMNLPVPP